MRGVPSWQAAWRAPAKRGCYFRNALWGEWAASRAPCGTRGPASRPDRASRRRSRTRILPISIHEEPIIEKKGLRGWSPRRSHLSALWFRCLGVPREAMNFSSSLVRMRGRARVVLPCVRDEGRAMRLISSILGQGAEVAERPKFSKSRESEATSAPLDRGRNERSSW